MMTEAVKFLLMVAIALNVGSAASDGSPWAAGAAAFCVVALLNMLALQIREEIRR
jgi:hypothetical protein